MATAPYCNVKLHQEAGDPHPANRLRRIPPNSTLNQVINIVNNNFNLVKGNFVQRGRSTEVVRIYNPQDTSQFVDVRQIIAQDWVNPFTGQTISFRR